MKTVTLTLTGKDCDLLHQDDMSDKQADALKEFLEFGEYFSVTITVDPETGFGTAKMNKP